MKRPATVSLTVVAAMGFAARAQAPAPDPCASPSFNGAVCQVALRQKGFCSQGSWIPMQYQQAYPYFYDLYQQYLAAGGPVTPAAAENCSRPYSGPAHGGFGAFGLHHHSGG